jgi:hypothetical protein
LTILFVVAMGRAAHAAPPPEVLKAAAARIDIAQSLATRLTAAYERGFMPLERVMEAHRSWFIANREAPQPAAKVVDAAVAYRGYVAKELELADVRYKRGAIGEADLMKVQSDLAEADFWLAEAKWTASMKGETTQNSVQGKAAQ